MLNVEGKTPRETCLCLHYLADQMVAQREDDGMKGIYSDVFTAEVRASDDFGIVTV